MKFFLVLMINILSMIFISTIVFGISEQYISPPFILTRIISTLLALPFFMVLPNAFLFFFAEFLNKEFYNELREAVVNFTLFWAMISTLIAFEPYSVIALILFVIFVFIWFMLEGFFRISKN